MYVCVCVYACVYGCMCIGKRNRYMCSYSCPHYRRWWRELQLRPKQRAVSDGESLLLTALISIASALAQ